MIELQVPNYLYTYRSNLGVPVDPIRLWSVADFHESMSIVCKKNDRGSIFPSPVIFDRSYVMMITVWSLPSSMTKYLLTSHTMVTIYNYSSTHLCPPFDCQTVVWPFRDTVMAIVSLPFVR